MGYARCAQQGLQFERNQGRKLRRLQDDGIAGHQRSHDLSRRNREGVVPGRNDSDHAIRLMQHATGLGLESEIAVRQFFFPQQTVSIFNQEARRIEHHQNFGE